MLLKRLEALPVGSFHYRLLILTGLGWMFDAMDTGLISFVLPVLAKEWNLSTSQMGMIGSIGLLGMAFGAVVAGTIADKIGRKGVFSLTLLLYSVATGLCALSWNFESLLVFRFFVGFGLGGELPVAATLVSEYAPSKVRGRFIVLLESFWGLGWIVAACIAYWFIPVYGWHWAFIIGAMPALYVFVIRIGMPESVRYLLSKGRTEEAEEIVRKLERKAGVEILDFDKNKDATEHENYEPSLASIWSGHFWKRTVMLWIAWFGLVFTYYGIFTWLPALVYNQGFTFIKTFEYVFVMTLAQLPGYFAAAWLVEIIGRKYTLSLFLLMTGVASWFFGQSNTVTSIVSWGCIMSFFNLGAWGVIYTYTPELYPTSIRAFGSGWAAGVGRLGGMLAPAMVGVLLQRGMKMDTVFYMFTAVLVFVSLMIILLGIETKQKNLENI
ncbi:MAG: MFS transporter [Acholeplasmataceae bacterium]|nr:MFS transporter [Acholeplasmataceae bacterium]